MTYFMFILLRPLRNGRDQFHIWLIFTQFWSRHHLNWLVDWVTSQDVYYVGTLNALASCMVGLVGPIKTSRPYCVHTYPYLFFQDRIKEMEKEFDLVLFSEMFDESMVLLADKLCWPLDYGSDFVFRIFSQSSQIFFPTKDTI